MKSRFLVPLCLLVFLLGCGETSRPRGPIGVVRAQIDALNKGQVDLATSYLSDDAQIIAPLGQPKGKVKIRALFLSAVKLKDQHEIVDLAADGENVTGNIMVKSVGLEKPVRMEFRATVLDGKITNWEIGNKAQ